MCSNIKRTFCCLYYEVKYFYNYYFKSKNSVSNYVPLEEVVVDSQPRDMHKTTSKNITTEYYPNYNIMLINQEIRKRKSLETKLETISEEEFMLSSSSSDTYFYNNDNDNDADELEWECDWDSEWQVV